MASRITRRNVVRAIAAAGATGLITRSSRAQDAPPAGLRVRVGGPAFSNAKDPEELALAHRKLGYRAAYCPGVALADKDRLADIVNAFAKHDVIIAEVGRWVNLLDADPAKRAANLKTVTDGLALAEAIGARCCVDIAGSFNPKSWFGPDPRNFTTEFFDAAVENARKIIDAVKPRRTKFTYEVMGWAYPDGPDSYLKMIKAIDRPAFGVHLDPCNAVNSPERFYRNDALIDEFFDKLGPHIASCHAKDLAWEIEMNVHFKEVPLGMGQLDYATYLKRLAGRKDVPLMMEHMKGKEEYEKSFAYLKETGRKVGVSLE